MLITALLLSLGAPFWYGALGKLLQLRSALAVKDDAQRLERQLSEPSAKTSAESPGRARGPRSPGGGLTPIRPQNSGFGRPAVR